MSSYRCMDEDWQLLTSFFPPQWRELAEASGALKGLRQDKSEEHLLRTLLLHVGLGYSLRETVVRARLAGLADLSDVALLKRLRKSEKWLHALCQAMFARRGLASPLEASACLRLIDGTQVKEPGATGSLWRIHYSLRLPALQCDFFEITPAKGKGTGESLCRYQAQAGEHLLADRGYSTAQGIAHIAADGADATVRLCPGNVRILGPGGKEFPLAKRLRSLTQPGELAGWEVRLTDQHGKSVVSGRICAIRKNEAAISLAKKKLTRRARNHVEEIHELTWLYAEYVLVFSTVPPSRLSPREVLDLYRLRWQVELVFKRFKQVIDLGHIPKREDASSRAWLYGKLFVALLTEELIAHAERFSPWGYP